MVDRTIIVKILLARTILGHRVAGHPCRRFSIRSDRRSPEPSICSAMCGQTKCSSTMPNLYRFVRSVSPQDLRSHLSQSDIPVPANLNWDAPAEEFSQGFL